MKNNSRPNLIKQIAIALFFIVVVVIAEKSKADDMQLLIIDVTGDFLDHFSIEEIQSFSGSRTVTTVKITKERED